ncbi:hypothetical protein [Limimaricola soesokkakensis]|uniref:hypothetical protein n=2 Tax=Limimaricola soesokkakensis TaxID=1343159 RepID=UPI00355998C5
MPVYWMLLFGAFGYLLKTNGYQVGPVILGVILSRLIDENWRRAIISEQEDLGRLFRGILTSPLSLVLFGALVFIFISQTPLWTGLRARFGTARARGDGV